MKSLGIDPDLTQIAIDIDVPALQARKQSEHEHRRDVALSVFPMFDGFEVFYHCLEATSHRDMTGASLASDPWLASKKCSL